MSPQQAHVYAMLGTTTQITEPHPPIDKVVLYVVPRASMLMRLAVLHEWILTQARQLQENVLVMKVTMTPLEQLAS